MNIDQYQSKIGITDISDHDIDFYKDGMVEELGEIFGIFKRIRRGDFHKMAAEKGWTKRQMEVYIKKQIIEEGGDFLWYFIRCLTKRKIKASTVLDFNYKKITRRKKQGKIMGEGHR